MYFVNTVKKAEKTGEGEHLQHDKYSKSLKKNKQGETQELTIATKF